MGQILYFYLGLSVGGIPLGLRGCRVHGRSGGNNTHLDFISKIQLSPHCMKERDMEDFHWFQ
jgi:hypothetical protein